MKLLLTLLVILFLGSSVWAQKQAPTVVFEKRHGKIMRIEKYRSVDVVNEKSFATPIYTFNEITLFRLEHRMTTYNKNEMIKLVSNFMKRRRKYFDFDKLRSFSVDCYFDKCTFELTEITYSIPPGLISKYSILRDLTDEIKNKANLSIKENFKDRLFVPLANSKEYAAKYFRLSFSIWHLDLKPYLNENVIKTD